jgi:hypothetical protein
MGDMGGAAAGGAGKAGGDLGAGAVADTSGGLGMGGGLDAGFGDPTGGMGSMAAGDPAAFGMDASGIPSSWGNQVGLNQGPPPGQGLPSDQPSLASGGPPGGMPAQAPPQPPDIGRLLATGSDTPPPQFNLGETADVRGPSGTPGDMQVAASDTPAESIQSRFPAYPGGQPPPTPEQQIQSRWPQGPGGANPPLPTPDPRGNWTDLVRPSDLPNPAQSMAGIPPVQPFPQDYQPPLPPQPSVANVDQPDPTKQGDTGTPPLPASGTAGERITPPAGGGGGGGTTAGGGQQVTPPGTPAPAGSMPQSPLEQLVGSFLHMLLGGGRGGIGPLEQLIARMFGLNPRQLFPQFYRGNPFAQPVGPGYFPPGTVGGRQIPGGAPGPGPRGPQLSGQQPGGRAPGPPPTPQLPPRSALAPSRRQQGGLPGGIYTAGRPDQPPPWYRPERNPAMRQTPLPSSSDIPRPPENIPGRVLGRAGGMDLPAAPGTSPQLSNVDPRLRDMLGAAKNKFEERNPGYRVMATSGYRGGTGQSQHGKRDAIDVQIFDPNGRAISNRGNDPTGLYRQYARLTYGVQRSIYPELNGRFAWGGAFGTQLGGGGPPDLMHFDLGGERGHWTGSRPSTMGPLSLLRGYEEPAA